MAANVYPIRVIDVECTTASSSAHGSIIFHKPTSWNFHTISHTWSKGLQSWADKIGSMLGTCNDEGNSSRVSYEDLFERENFSGHSCYAPFMDFLLLMQADGVKYAWLDALCINQGSDSQEKSQELRNMGSYYAKSLGCYVCVHGFGEGFQIWKNIDQEEEPLLLPRWFSRVWALQEIILPRKVIFIFHLSQLVKKTINALITFVRSGLDGLPGPCKCVMRGSCRLPSPSSLVTFSEEDNLISEEQPPYLNLYEIGERVEIVGVSDVTSACSHCGSCSLIRKPSDKRLQALARNSTQHSNLLAAKPAVSASALTDLYFVDRECIVDFMLMALQQHSAVMYPSGEPADQSPFGFGKLYELDEWKLMRLRTIMEQAKRTDCGMHKNPAAAEMCVCEPVQVVLETARRDCTWEEDRVLAIIGLLGIEGVMQLRTGKNLEAQLLDMAQQLVRSGNTRTLVKLSMAQFVGHSAEEGNLYMSWAPTLKQDFSVTGKKLLEASEQQLKWREKRRLTRLLQLQGEVEEGSERAVAEQGHVMKYFVEEIVVDCVQNNGVLNLAQAKVLWDCLFVRDAQNKNRFHLQVFDSSKSCIVQTYAFDAYFSAVACLLHRVAFVGAGRRDEFNILTHQSIVRLEGEELESRLMQFRVHVVLLGQVKLPGEAVYEVSMVCVGRAGEISPLHKVGIAWLIPSLHRVFMSLAPSQCMIGGCTDYMEQFVLPINQPLILQEEVAFSSTSC